MSNINIIRRELGGKALGATLYVLIYSLYTIAYSYKLNINLIRVGYVLFYALTLWYTLKVVLKNNKSPFLRILILFFLLIIIYGTVYLLQGKAYGTTQPSTFLMVHIASVLPVFAFYYFGEKERLSNTWFALILVIFIIDAYCLYNSNKVDMLESLKNADEGFTNNSGYIWASLLPFVAFLNKRKILQYLSIGIIMLFVLLCFKRGAIVVAVVALLYFMLYSMKKTGLGSKMLIVLLTLAVMVFLFNYMESLLSQNLFFAARMEKTLEGDSSGRDIIYLFFFKYFFSAENGVNILFGNGAFYTIKLFGIEAHNDWLEYAIDLGLIGIVMYIIYWKRIANNYFYFSKNNNDNTFLIAMGMVVIINFIRTFISMSFNDISFFSAALLGYTMAVVDKQRQV